MGKEYFCDGCNKTLSELEIKYNDVEYGSCIHPEFFENQYCNNCMKGVKDFLKTYKPEKTIEKKVLKETKKKWF